MSKLNPPVNKYDHVLGPVNAAITLVEYGDYQCPHCGGAYPIVNQILKVYDNKLRFAYRHFPLTNAHPYAFPAAVAAEAAGKQRKFWDMHNIIFERQELLSERVLLDYANEIGLDMTTFRMNLSDRSLSEKVESDFESGVMSGVNGTPSFFINGYKHDGNYEYNTLTAAIEEKMQLA